MDALEKKVLRPLGFRCFTLGRNISLPEQPDDAVRRLMSCCECLIAVATERLAATDRDTPEKTLTLATPYLLQETSMAFQADLPFLVFKTPDVTLLGVTNRNLWLGISPNLRNGRVNFNVTRDQLYTALSVISKTRRWTAVIEFPADPCGTWLQRFPFRFRRFWEIVKWRSCPNSPSFLKCFTPGANRCCGTSQLPDHPQLSFCAKHRWPPNSESEPIRCIVAKQIPSRM